MRRVRYALAMTLSSTLVLGCLTEGRGGPVDQPPLDGSAPTPWLPFPAGTSMGVTQKPGCDGHLGSLEYSYDFNIAGRDYETDNDLVAAASSDGTVVEVTSHVVGSCSSDAECRTEAFNDGWGNCVIIRLDNTQDEIYERYCHLDSSPGAIFVSEGQHVCHGTPLGLIGNTGRSSGAHLHWQREDRNGQSIPIDRFVEVDISDDCNACTIYTYTSPGCFDSQNTQPAECQAPPADPCTGLASGYYCGSSPQLGEYGGNDSDLVTCENGILLGATPCAEGCRENPPGENDVCEGVPCGNGIIDGGEACDGADLGGSSCAALEYDGGQLSCGASCQFDTAQCCSDECSPGSSTCSGGAVTRCEFDGACYRWSSPVACERGCDGNSCADTFCGDDNTDPGEQCDGYDLDGMTCQSLGYDGGDLACQANCLDFDTSACCTQEHTILNAEFPSYTSSAAGCSVDGGISLRLSAQQISSSTMRFYVKKPDGSAWGQAATLRLYVGSGPSCGFPSNVIKATAPVVVGQATQTIDLVVDPYGAAWGLNETKQFWVGKSEAGYPAARSTGTISIKRECN